MRTLALLLLLPACSSVSSQEQDRLASYQRNAALFFEGGKYGQAMINIERGLEIDPTDYKLNSMKGGILLLVSGNDYKKLDEATTLLAHQFEQRSASRHEPHLLMNYARALQKQGMRHVGEAVRLEGQASRDKTADVAALTKAAAAERKQADELLTKADDLLGELIAQGAMLRLAHHHRLQIALQMGNDAGFLAESEAYFKQSKAAIDGTVQQIDKAVNVDYEREQVALLSQLKDEAMQVHATVAEFHFARKQYQAAKDHLDEVLKTDPRRVRDYYNRGRVLLELGKLEEAKTDFRRFLADPSEPANSERATFALQVLSR